MTTLQEFERWKNSGYSKLEIPSSEALEDVIKILTKKSKERKKLKTYHADVLSDVNKIKKTIKQIIWHDYFYDKKLPDKGFDFEIYYIIKSELYKVSLHCDVEWVGDYSVRKNLPENVSIISITKIENFEIIKDYNDYKVVTF